MTETSSRAQVRPGSFEDALANGFQLLDQEPAAALKQAEALALAKRDVRVFRLAAAACRKLGMKIDAEGAELGAIEAGLSDPRVEQITIAAAEGRAVEAQQLAAAMVGNDPEDLLAKTLLAETSIELWQLDHAEQLLKEVLERAPGFRRASMLLSACFNRQVRMKDAIDVVDGVLARKRDDVKVLSNLGQLLTEVGNNDRATSVYEDLVQLEPGRADRWAQLGHYYRIVGSASDSIAALRQALVVDPFNGAAWWNLVNFFPDQLKSGDEQTIRTALDQRLGQTDEGALHVTLGLLEERRGNYSTAFDHFVAGKRARLAARPYDPGPISSAVDGVIDLMIPEFYRQRHGVGWADQSVTFVIGMPRSGTTMVERMLGRHSAIEGAGELRIMTRLAELVRHQGDEPEHYAAMLRSMSNEQLAWVGRRYIEASADYRRTNKPIFIDKNNLNWMQLGLIMLALPNAKVIDIRRNALDCCWANFKMLFSGGFPATNDLRHVGQIYRDYVRLFDAVSEAAPGRILPVRYEDVVENIEDQARRMLDFIGLEYEAECINFHLAKGAVATPSSEQVRQPLNRKGIGSSEPYRQWLGPLIEELGPLADGTAAA